MADKKGRLAIILIHGMGKQRPIVTLRGFVESITEQLKKNKQASPEDTLFWDKPDSLMSVGYWRSVWRSF